MRFIILLCSIAISVATNATANHIVIENETATTDIIPEITTETPTITKLPLDFIEKMLATLNGTKNVTPSMNHTNPQVDSIVIKLCLDLLNDTTICKNLHQMFLDEKYLQLTWEITVKLFFERPFGVVLFICWTLIMCIINLGILLLCTLLKPLRSLLLVKIVSDLRRRYYFTNDSSELHIIENPKRNHPVNK